MIRLPILLFLIATSLVSAEELTRLLKAYELASDHSEKTKNESAGNLIVYTRNDLERMQAHTLKDLLKSMRFFQYADNRLGQPDMLNSDPVTFYSKSVRIYLNDRELLEPLAGSGFMQFGNIELDFINHVEIYQGFPSFDFGIEPATIVVRLYTKNSKHDNGARFKANLGSHGANTQNIYRAGGSATLSYFFYLHRNDDRKGEKGKDGHSLKRDIVTERFFGSVATQEHRFELHGMRQRSDGFMGAFIGAVPQDADAKTHYLDAALHSTFLDNSLTLDLNYLTMRTKRSDNYSGVYPILSVMPLVQIENYKSTVEEESFSALLKRAWHYTDHTLTAGLQYRYKFFDLTDAATVTIPAVPMSPVTQAYNKEHIYSLYLQDLYRLNDSELLSLSIMGQRYRRNGSVKDPSTVQLRLGYIFTDDRWVAKTFISHQEFVSEAYMTVSPLYGNANLKPETYASIFQEVSYSYEDTLTKLILGYGKNEMMPILDMTTATMTNSPESVYGIFAGLEWSVKMADNDKLELQLYALDADSPIPGAKDIVHYGGMVRLLNTFGKVDLFNELVVRDGYTGIDIGFDYSAGIVYHVTKDLTFNLKGVNLLDSALEWDYLNRTTPTLDTVKVPTVERRIWAGMEYLF